MLKLLSARRTGPLASKMLGPDGYNITCKALGISAIIKGSRGKRDSKGFKAIVNSLKTTQGLRESARSTGGSRIFLAAGYVG